MASSTLETIRDKVRKITRSPSDQQLSDASINEYINTFIAYDFPQEIRLFPLHTTAEFVLSPFIDTYDLSTILVNPLDPTSETLSNAILNINPPIYIDGYKAFYTQSRDEFFNIYPFNNNLTQVGSGDGVTTNFTGTINNGYLLANNVMIASIDAVNGGLSLSDNGSGIFVGDGTGTVDYVTGDFDVNFDTAPGQDQDVNCHFVQYTPTRPSALLFYQTTLTVRPVPDQPYTLSFEYQIPPIQLIDDADNPQLKQWWQYIAYGASKKVFEDRMDLESVQQIMPELKRQERLVLRRTLVQNATQRTATIYSQQSSTGAAFGNWYNGF